MRTTFLVAGAALASGVLASPMVTPVAKRDTVIETGWYETVVDGKVKTISWSTQFEQGAAPTPAPAPSNNNNNNNHKAPAAPPAGSGDDGKDYKQTVLDHHNAHRANHSAPALTWDAGLEASATEIGQRCIFEHIMDVDGGGYGQNLAVGLKASDVGRSVSELWYGGEMPHYTYYGQEPSMDDFGSWGHFTQVVWKDTSAVGCATVDCTAQGGVRKADGIPPYITVCNYKGPGNFGGQYAKNVGRPKGEAPIS